MRKNTVKKIVAGFVAAIMIAGINSNVVWAEESPERPYLDLDPSTVFDSGQVIEDMPSVQAYGGSNIIVQMDGSKKGIQGTEWLSAKGSTELGVRHVLINLCMSPILINGDTEYTYNEKVYKFNSNYLKSYISNVQALNRMGIAVTVVLLMQDDRNLKGWEELVYHPERGHNFYALSTKTDEARDTWRALFGYLSEVFGQSDCHIENWILGNEVNMPSAYNWTGTLSLQINAKVFAQSFVLLYDALQNQNLANQDKPDAKAYISLDRGWNDTAGYSGMGAKAFLDRFVMEVNKIQSQVEWCIAFHPYAAVMDAGSPKFSEQEKLLWGNNKYTPNNINAQFVTAANLNVLTDYVKNTYGPQHRIILSEQGFDAKGGEDYQAASLAYTFYAGQFNDMVDAVIFRSWRDHAEEYGLKLGISGRKAQSVFQYMDTNVYGGSTGLCLKKIGVKNWKSLIPNFAMTGMAYQDVTDQSWYLDAVNTVNNAGLMTGMNEEFFGAVQNLERGQFATILYRMEGNPQQGYVNKFPDVPDQYFFSIPVSWANSKNIIQGYGHNGLFGTSDEITREQMATLMYRYARYKGKDTSKRVELSRFRDGAGVSGFAGEAMQWIVAEGIIQGEGSNGLLNPQGKVSRAVCATIIQRFMNF
ncbi:MAG: DUF5722 domain-containing protein [Muricomes sp.]